MPLDAGSSNSTTVIACHRVAIIKIAALWHDLGKATNLFQEKLNLAISNKNNGPDPIRHEIVSAMVWDILTAGMKDQYIIDLLKKIKPEQVDAAWKNMPNKLIRVNFSNPGALPFSFTKSDRGLAYEIGMLILTHHRLPAGDTDFVTLMGDNHFNSSKNKFDRNALSISANGQPFWHKKWWIKHIQRDAGFLIPDIVCHGLDMAMRSSLMFADHIGSAMKEPSIAKNEHLANTIKKSKKKFIRGDSLSKHVKRVYSHCYPAYDMLHGQRENYPGLGINGLPDKILRPDDGISTFKWQSEAIRAAADLSSSREGGFFCCVIAGTGTGKTRGAPGILAAATMNDIRLERRSFRMTLGLGLRTLATQSATEYVEDLGFSENDVSVLIGQKQIEFIGDNENNGSESLDFQNDINVKPISDFLENQDSFVKKSGLIGKIPKFLNLVKQNSGSRAGICRDFAEPPILVATIDHIMGVAEPSRSSHLLPAIRVMTSDLILDEVDQYNSEDIAAISKLVYQAAASGRRVIIMSATLTKDIATAFYHAYRAGWNSHAMTFNLSDHVNTLCVSDAPGSATSNAIMEFEQSYTVCADRLGDMIKNSPALRRGEILPSVSSFTDLVAQADIQCSRMHELHASEINGFNISVGLIRMNRINHAVKLATKLPSGRLDNKFRIKICLHSNFSILYRKYIEDQLKKALTRKNGDTGILKLCEKEDLFHKASDAGTKNIEIVCISSPVIETGNDIDFDYAIIDPISIRSVIQTAGRVNRHRRKSVSENNILILGKSMTVVENGVMAYPGIETPLAKDTMVSNPFLSERDFGLLCKEIDFSSITSMIALSDDYNSELKSKELRLLKDMLAYDGNGVIKKYLEKDIVRFNTKNIKARTFRRSTSEILKYILDENKTGAPVWTMMLRNGYIEIDRSIIKTMNFDNFAFQDIDEASRKSMVDFYSISERDRNDVLSIDIADYGYKKEGSFMFSRQTGLTRLN